MRRCGQLVAHRQAMLQAGPAGEAIRKAGGAHRKSPSD